MTERIDPGPEQGPECGCHPLNTGDPPGYIEIWAVPAPPDGSRYRVLQDRWNEDQQTRTIFAWEPAP